MKAIEIARKFAEYNQVSDAQKSYILALDENNSQDPMVDFEAASYLLASGSDYKMPYTYFVKLYNDGHFQREIFDIVVNAFYAPNLKQLEKAYHKNCMILKKYKYIFKTDFLEFDDLPIKLFPFDDNGFIPFYMKENRFGEYINFMNPIVDRYFFQDLDKPVYTEELFSQYQLEYLNDNVRKSEWVAKDNHIYLHYSDWSVFCSYLTGLNLTPLLKDEKFVFLFEDESSLYPIDFQERFGINYSQNSVRPIGIREVNKMIWHTQLASHNGGDFFNEIFYGHPNLLADQSIMFSSIQKSVKEIKAFHKKGQFNTNLSWELKNEKSDGVNLNVMKYLRHMKYVTDKDVLVAMFMSNSTNTQNLDRNSRIAPALFFQPHFSNMIYSMNYSDQGVTISSDEYNEIKNSRIFQDFKYIKTFSPMRRITTSHAATVRFAQDKRYQGEEGNAVIADMISIRALNRSFMIDWQDRLCTDSRLVRFEDGKLNPKATFTALAEFLDVPYTESMTYCSLNGEINPQSMPGNAIGFDPAPVYRNYEEYANESERYFLEYCMRDAYQCYGYDFQHYDGGNIDEEKAEALIKDFAVLDGCMRRTFLAAISSPDEFSELSKVMGAEEREKWNHLQCDNYIQSAFENRLKIINTLMKELYFINENHQPLRMMTPLALQPELLEQPLYH